MKKILLLSVLILFSCSKDSDSEEETVVIPQNLIDEINGKMFSQQNASNFVTAWWFDKSNEHPSTRISVQWRNNEINGVQCYKNYYLQHLFGNSSTYFTLQEFNVLTNDATTYKTEVLYSSTINQNVCGLSSQKWTMTISSSEIQSKLNGVETLILDNVIEYNSENPNNDVGCNPNTSNDSRNLYLVEDFPITPSELCSLSD
jgi:hypothetical protein